MRGNKRRIARRARVNTPAAGREQGPFKRDAMQTTISSLFEIVDAYDGLLFDAYGVLVDDTRLIPGAASVWESLKKRGVPCWILTNGSARTLEETVANYAAKGLLVQAEHVINSASLLKAYFLEKGLQGKKTAVMGTAGSRRYVLDAGGHIVDPLSGDFEVLVVANQTDYPLLETMEAVLSTVLARIARGVSVHLILTNPDLIYPKDGQRFGITAGSVALVLEQALRARHGTQAPVFDRLGKPHARIFAEAVRRAGSRRLLMIGDQLETDVRGARDFGLDSLLIGTGLIPAAVLSAPLDPEPTYVLASWELSCSSSL